MGRGEEGAGTVKEIVGHECGRCGCCRGRAPPFMPDAAVVGRKSTIAR